MPGHDNSGDSASVDLAMNQVLEAERDARDAVAGCRSEAERIMSAAEERVRRVSRLTERRIQAAHRIADAAVERALRLLSERDGGRRSDSRLAETDQERIERAVDRLVDEILGDPR